MIHSTRYNLLTHSPKCSQRVTALYKIGMFGQLGELMVMLVINCHIHYILQGPFASVPTLRATGFIKGWLST